MQLGMIGLGRMGANMVRRLLRAGHEVVVFDVDPDKVAALTAEGGIGAASLEELAARLDGPRAIWAMVPVAFTSEVLHDVAPFLDPDDVLVDGSNNHYVQAIEEARGLADHGIELVDVGVSGGVWGLDRGYSLMVGGSDDAVSRLVPVFETLAPGLQAATRTPGRRGDPEPEELGWLHCGQVGSGHFVKMVHNGIEYGMMAAYAEGFALMAAADSGLHERARDAETTPLHHPEHYEFDLPLDRIAEVWRRGAVIGSWLLDLTAAELLEDPELSGFEGRVSDSGEGRWTVQAAIDVGTPANVIASALFSRFASRGNDRYAGRVLSAMRKAFGGHHEQPGEHRR